MTARHPSQRTPLAIALSVWKALFLREAVARLFTGRASWFWLIAEPVFHVAYLLLLYTVVRAKTVGGIDVVLWLMAGLIGFLTFRRTGTQVGNAIGPNKALFAYRQVKPIDTALVRAALEGFLIMVVATVLYCGAAIRGHDVLPAQPFLVMLAFLGLWLLGLGFGLVTSVASELVPEIGRLVKFAMMPLYFISGVLVPIAAIPQPFRSLLLLNPIAHGLEAARLGFASHYHAVPGLSVPYLYAIAAIAILLGLSLHRRFATKLASQ